MNLDDIRTEIVRNGFKRTHDLVKLEEFESPNGHVIYLYKAQVLLKHVRVMVHPQLNDQLFVGLEGVAADAVKPLRSGTNMRRFLQRRSSDTVRPTFYGRSMRAQTLGALERLLCAVLDAPVPKVSFSALATSVHFAAVHERNSWRTHTIHRSVETATSGPDGAENLLRRLKRVSGMWAQHGPVLAVLVWVDAMQMATALRLASGSSTEIERVAVPVSLLESFTSHNGPTQQQIDGWFHTPALAEGMWHPDELPSVRSYREGSAFQILVNAYERNQEARQACIDHYGPICKVCDFDFEDRYGPIGTGYIHVHHEIPISTIGADYQIDPVRDLKPLCPNCHAMAHRKEPPLSIAALRTLLQRNQCLAAPDNALLIN